MNSNGFFVKYHGCSFDGCVSFLQLFHNLLCFIYIRNVLKEGNTNY